MLLPYWKAIASYPLPLYMNLHIHTISVGGLSYLPKDPTHRSLSPCITKLVSYFSIRLSVIFPKLGYQNLQVYKKCSSLYAFLFIFYSSDRHVNINSSVAAGGIREKNKNKKKTL